MEDADSFPEYSDEHYQQVLDILNGITVESEDDYEQSSRQDRIVWDVMWFWFEVENGGMDQYFYNSAGDHAMQALEALKNIGAPVAHADLKAACDLFPNGQPNSDRETRQNQLEVIRKNHDVELIDDVLDSDPAAFSQAYEDVPKLLFEFWKKAEAESNATE